MKREKRIVRIVEIKGVISNGGCDEQEAEDLPVVRCNCDRDYAAFSTVDDPEAV